MDLARAAAPNPAIPFDAPRARSVLDLWGDVKAGLDFIAHNLPRGHAFFRRLNPYPRPWRVVHVPLPDGAALEGCFGQGRPDGPVVLFAPGTFQTKEDTPRKRRAIDLWRRLGASVLILDLRGFGGSHRYPGSGGHLEAEDLLHAADWLRDATGAPRVILWGESLGGAVSLLAAANPGAPARFERVIAWSPFADLGDAARVAEQESILGRTYRWLLRRRAAGKVRTFAEFLRLRATELGLPYEELLRRGSPRHHLADLRVPALVLHAEDDPIVPVHHAHLLRAATEATDAPLRVLTFPRGGHLDFDRVAPRWYEATTRALVG